MHKADKTKYEDISLEIYNIGWLDTKFDFKRGHVDNSCIEKLFTLTSLLKTAQTRGIHPCPFCENFNEGRYLIQNKTVFLGSAEIWIPNNDFTKIFSAPNLVIHYITNHNYLPPEEFIEAIIDFDINANWSSNTAYENYLDFRYKGIPFSIR